MRVFKFVLNYIYSKRGPENFTLITDGVTKHTLILHNSNIAQHVYDGFSKTLVNICRIRPVGRLSVDYQIVFFSLHRSNDVLPGLYILTADISELTQLQIAHTLMHL